jgi:hypothetical protein
MGDNGVIAYRVAQHPDLKTLDDKSFPEEGFGIVVKKGDKALLDKLTRRPGRHSRRRQLPGHLQEVVQQGPERALSPSIDTGAAAHGRHAAAGPSPVGGWRSDAQCAKPGGEQ